MGLIKPKSDGISLPTLSNPAGAENIQSGYEAIDGNGNKITGLHTEPTVADFTNDATAQANMILKGKTAYVRGEKITGTILNQLGETITPGTADKTIKAGKYLAGTLTIKGDANLKAANIKSGVSIFGVTGGFNGKEVISGSIKNATVTNSSSGNRPSTITIPDLIGVNAFLLVPGDFTAGSYITARYYPSVSYLDGICKVFCVNNSGGDMYTLNGTFDSATGKISFDTVVNNSALNLGFLSTNTYQYLGYK